MNEQFLKRMQGYLQEEYEEYLKTLDEDAYHGFRVNTAKLSVDQFHDLKVCVSQSSPICPESFYIPKDIKGLGNHPAHLVSLFYMQEPSAASAVEVPNIQWDDWVLDMCAAPGGKNTQITAKLQDRGFLVSNEIESRRAQIPLSNMERLGFSQCTITNTHPQQIAKEIRGQFDQVLVDAPCSGEGTFKKHSKAIGDWSEEYVLACAQRQLHILDSVYAALKENGMLVYSTCAYSMEENEQMVYAFMKQHPDMELVDCGITSGRRGLPYLDLDTKKLRRVSPMDQGEGHFVAKFRKHGVQAESRKREEKPAVIPVFATQFIRQSLQEQPAFLHGSSGRICAMQQPFLKLKDIRTLRQGCQIGEVVKNRLGPHQHFYVSNVYGAGMEQCYEMDGAQYLSFLQGQQLPIAGYKGYTQTLQKGYALDFAKGDGMVLKSKYSKGLRIH